MKKFHLILLAFLPLISFSQSHYAVLLKEKDAVRVTQFINNPSEMLSQRAIYRHDRLNIPFDAIDVPIDKTFITECKDTGASILAHSKWLNTIFVDATTEQINTIKSLSFVKEVKLLEEMASGKKIPNSTTTTLPLSKKESIYGKSDVFVKQIKVDYLHNKGFTGEGIQIAVLDAGFPGVNTTDTFKELRDRSGILGTYNFVEGIEDVYRDDGHGTMVLSTMATNKPNNYLGTAYNADYWLFTTEDNNAETPREEMFWIEAIEFADSVGVDVVNSSLGYYDFDLPFTSYTYSDMDGKTTFISRAANIGGQKGIIVVISAGNEGNKTWHYIAAPADAENIISVGAINSSGTIAGFSSFGPTANSRIKPDVVAMGVNVPIYTESGSLSNRSGTSFSSPILAGSVACLRQAFPKASVTSIIDAMRRSADNYITPDDRTGYGIANLEGAYNLLKAGKTQFDICRLIISPNPVLDKIYVNGINSKDYNFEIYDALGRQIKKGYGNFIDGVNISDLKAGLYQLIISDKSSVTLSLLKK